MKQNNRPTIREATIDDAATINDIANWYIEHTSINFDTQPWDLDKRIQWVREFNLDNCPYYLLVAESEEKIVGFAYNTYFRPKNAYCRSTETTIYIQQGMSRHGIGEMLYRELFNLILLTNLHRAFAIITLPNPASIRLHEKLGFYKCGLLSDAGWKFNAFHSITIYQMKLNN
ncbi:MAG: GNAT family N-acetyltransferase [Gammaproteobacteria bacterium]|nr:GNAT family N-acetyltransferase [Gammaproteobacteria bacterium]MCY4274199.1 GNAT family N-acetyltransferase [Gammaproteobacteria bacterium]